MEQQIYQSEVYPTLAVCQFPLCLAWAVTIHKIQGSSLSHAQIDIGSSIFEYGQTYVALSRVKTMDGLYLMNFQPNRIKSHPKVIAFYESLT
jgi:ATP-dependent DNA helicase PIF1